MSEREFNEAMQDYELHKKPLISYVFLGFLASALGLGAWMIATQQEKLVVDKTSMEDVLQGRTAFAFEKKFEEVFPLKDTAVGTFGAVSYGLLHTGRDGVVIGKDGWFFTKEEFEVLKHADKAFSDKIAFIKDVQHYLNQQHVGLVVALIPAKTRVYEEYLQDGVALPEVHRYTYEQFRKELVKNNVVAPDLEMILREGKAGAPMFMKTDTHWTAQGAQRVAQAMAETVKQSCPAISLTEKAFKTTEGVEKSYDGDLLRYVKTGFMRSVVGPSSEKVVAHQTDADGGDSDLFGDAKMDVALVGTSYSMQKDWHFEGYLKEALHADVLNLADEGKGPIEPMVNFLNKHNLKAEPLKLVVWEIPERFIQKTYDITLPDMKKMMSSSAQDSVVLCSPNVAQGGK